MCSVKKDHPEPIHRIAKYINEIVLAATASPRNRWNRSAIHCRRSPQHQKCSGRLLVREKGNGEIEYKCPDCSENGIITGWQNTIYNLDEFRIEGQGFTLEVVLDERHYDELKNMLYTQIEFDWIIYSAIYTKEGIILKMDTVDARLFMHYLEEIMEKQTKAKHQELLTSVIRCIQVLLGSFSFISPN
jgi:phage FluMu protein Com